MQKGRTNIFKAEKSNIGQQHDSPNKQLTNLQGQRTDDNVMHQAVNA